MQKCPNCGQPTMRTEDWACQFCGYPLLSGAFRKVPKTYRRLQEERFGTPAYFSRETPAVYKPQLNETEESQAPPPAPEPEIEDVTPVVLPSEREAEPVAEVEVAVEPPMGEAQMPEEPVAVEATEEVAEVAPPAAVVEEILQAAPSSLPDLSLASGSIAVTVDELNNAFQADKQASHEQLTEKVIRVTGIVEKVVVRDHLDIRYVLLTGASKTGQWNVRGTFPGEHMAAISRLTKGEAVTIQGVYKGYERNLLMRECSIIG